MNFRPRRHRTPVLQIISMIDILIILLIFLVVSTTFNDPKKARSILNLNLPASSGMALAADKVERISVSVTSDQKILLGETETAPEALPAALKTLRTTRPEAKLDLALDESVSFGLIIKVWDALTQAGYPVNEVPARVKKAAAAGK